MNISTPQAGKLVERVEMNVSSPLPSLSAHTHKKNPFNISIQISLLLILITLRHSLVEDRQIHHLEPCSVCAVRKGKRKGGGNPPKPLANKRSQADLLKRILGQCCMCVLLRLAFLTPHPKHLQTGPFCLKPRG